MEEVEQKDIEYPYLPLEADTGVSRGGLLVD